MSLVNGVTSTRTSRTFTAGLTVEVAEDSLDRVQKLLAGVKGGWQKAVGSALKRAANAGRTAVKGAVTKEYTVSQHEFLASSKNVNHYRQSPDGGVSVEFGYRGYVIPLIKFNTKIGRDGRVVTQVKRSSAAATLDHAFAAQMGGHMGIYERLTGQRFPVRELYGPAAPQMVYSNEEVTDAFDEKAAETYQNRIEHEILRIMNGWGV